MTIYDPVEWGDFVLDVALDPYSPSEPEAGPDVVPISVRCSSDWEAVTAPEITFLWVPRVAVAAGLGV